MAITRGLSNGDEVIEYAAFPMMRKPMLATNEEPSEEGDVTGVTAILEFDPEHPESKPDWLEAKVMEPIDAILKWIAKKEMAIYQAAGLSVFYGTHSEARSGVALRAELTQLAALLISKSRARDDAETQALRFWRLLEGKGDDPQLRISRPVVINLDELRIILENILLAKTSVRSETFKRELEKKIARQILPNTAKETLAVIEEEIDDTAQQKIDEIQDKNSEEE